MARGAPNMAVLGALTAASILSRNAKPPFQATAAFASGIRGRQARPTDMNRASGGDSRGAVSMGHPKRGLPICDFWDYR